MNLKEIELKLKTLQKQTDEIEKAIEEFKKNSKPKTVYDLTDGDKYWVVGCDGAINGCTFLNGHTDEKIISIGSAFLTEEEAKYEVKCREVYTQLKKYSYDFSYEEWHDNSLKKYYLKYVINGSIYIDYEYWHYYGGLCFRTVTDAQLAIDEIDKENIIKYYFRVKDYKGDK